MKLARRTLLQATALLAATPLLSAKAAGAAATLGAQKFPWGIASGDPLEDRVILWTKVVLGESGESIVWQVARDKKFQQIVQSGKARATPADDGIVKLDCAGLDAGQSYYYRFLAGKLASPIGRTKTLPQGSVDKIKLGVCSCANFNSGFFTSYRGLAAQDDLDLVVHLGDYIYEYGSGIYGKLAGRSVQPRGECLTLADYRTRYAHYRTDPDLQKLHARHPMIAVWDDHEIANNGHSTGAQNHSPQKEGNWNARTKAARRAYFEWLPLRGDWQEPIYRSFKFGNLATLMMIDTRYDNRDKEITHTQFVKKYPRGKTSKDSKAGDKLYYDKAAYEKAVFNPHRAIMSRAQTFWLKNNLRRAASQTRWSIIGNQIPFQPTYTSPFKLTKDTPKIVHRLMGLVGLAKRAGVKQVPLSLDEWSGFPVAQAALVAQIKKAQNPTLVLTGDTHNGWATFFGDKLGIELGAPGVSSPGTEAYIPKSLWGVLNKTFARANPSFFFRDVNHRGFMMVEIEPDRATANWVWADATKRRGRFQKGPKLSMPRADLAKSKLTES